MSRSMTKPSAGIAAAFALAMLLSAKPSPTTVPGVTPDPFVTGIVSLATYETAQLNVSNVSADRAVTVQMALYDAAGLVLARSRELLEPGESKFLVPTARRTGRQGVRASVHVMSGDEPLVPPDPIRVASTLEVVDLRTGATKLVLVQ